MTRPFDLDELKEFDRWNDDYMRGIEAIRLADTPYSRAPKPVAAAHPP